MDNQRLMMTLWKTRSANWSIQYSRYSRKNQLALSLDRIAKLESKGNKSSSGDEIPERDVTYHLLCLLIYNWTIRPTCRPTSRIFLSIAVRFGWTECNEIILFTCIAIYIKYTSISNDLQCPLHVLVSLWSFWHPAQLQPTLPVYSRCADVITVTKPSSVKRDDTDGRDI